MRFWDTSALVPLVLAHASSDAVRTLRRQDPFLVVAWTTGVECASAIARVVREGALDSPGERAAFERLARLADAWIEVEPLPPVQQVAIRLVRAHPLRAADAVQLASALAVVDGDPASLAFVTLDERLAQAAEREGLRIVVPGVEAR